MSKASIGSGQSELVDSCDAVTGPPELLDSCEAVTGPVGVPDTERSGDALGTGVRTALVGVIVGDATANGEAATGLASTRWRRRGDSVSASGGGASRLVGHAVAAVAGTQRGDVALLRHAILGDASPSAA